MLAARNVLTWYTGHHKRAVKVARPKPNQLASHTLSNHHAPDSTPDTHLLFHRDLEPPKSRVNNQLEESDQHLWIQGFRLNTHYPNGVSLAFEL